VGLVSFKDSSGNPDVLSSSRSAGLDPRSKLLVFYSFLPIRAVF
jgi:hypothetical protein